MGRRFLWIQTAISRFEPQVKLSLRDVERADFILVVGADPINEAPMLAMAMRQAKRNGADVVVLDPRSVELPFTLQHVPVPHDALCIYLGYLIKRVVDSGEAHALGERAAEFFDALPDDGALNDSQLQLEDQVLRQLQQSRRPVMVCNTEMVSASTIGVTADFALLLQASEKQAGVFYLMPGANAFAGGMLSEENNSFLRIIEDIENGSTRALILAEVDPYWHFPDRQRLERALDKLDLLVVFDYLNSRALDKAHISFPTATVYETGGLFINQEGRVQNAPRAFSGGIPIMQTGGGNHPPRLYDGGLPGAHLRAAWRELLQFTGGMTSESENNAAENLWEMLTHTIPQLADFGSNDHLPQEGVRLEISEHADLRFSVNWSSEMDYYRSRDDTFELLLVDRTFGTEELSSLSPCLRELERKPCIGMHSDQAETMGLKDGDLLEIDTKTGSLRVELCTAENMAPGTLVLPRHRALEWQIFGNGKIRIRKEQIRKKI
jgi:NADH-quinone oxidoreductase subunit G